MRLLGPIEALRDGRPVPLGGARRRAVLALLALQPGHVVPVARLIDGVWGDPAPETATTALQGHISQLRRVLGADAIVTRAPGYLLDVDPESVDVSRAERALAAGGAEAISRALGEFRGEPLADVVDAPRSHRKRCRGWRSWALRSPRSASRQSWRPAGTRSPSRACASWSRGTRCESARGRCS